jgi:hypothetical protein
MNLLQTLMCPDEEELELGERVLVAKAANILQVGEFQLLQLAYREWHDKNLPETMVSLLFSSYMLKDEVPHWARHYARKIINAEANGRLNDNHPSFHAYDHNYHTFVPNGLSRFWIAVVILTAFIGGTIVLADLSVTQSAVTFPPYLDQNDLKRPVQAASFGRADTIAQSVRLNSSLPDMGDAYDQTHPKPTGMLPAPP